MPEDENVLEDSGGVLSSRERQAVAARLEYKRVTQACADLLVQYVEHLRSLR